MEGSGSETFLESLMDTSLYSMGAYFSDQHPELVDEVIPQSARSRNRASRLADADDLSLEPCFETLMTGLAVRYYKASLAEPIGLGADRPRIGA